MIKLIKDEESLKHVTTLYVFVFLVWGFYRFLFRFPEVIEEVIFKPLLWLGPAFYLLYREKKGLASVGWTSQNLLPSLVWGLGLGTFFALEGILTYGLKSGNFSFIGFNFSTEIFVLTFALSLATAISEETVFRGFIFNRLWFLLKDEYRANFISSVGWSLVHLPITIFVFQFSFLQIMAYTVLTFAFGVGSSFVFARTKNIIACILLHIFWGWPIILFR